MELGTLVHEGRGAERVLIIGPGWDNGEGRAPASVEALSKAPLHPDLVARRFPSSWPTDSLSGSSVI